MGGNRTYAYLGRDEFAFANWAEAVRSGNTLVTSGPLLLFRADGRVPGEETTLGAGGGTVEVEVNAHCFVPFQRLEVVMYVRVVSSREVKEGTRKLVVKEKVQVPGPAWLAARCYSNLAPKPAGGDPIGGYSISAHTSPVYVKIPGQELFSALSATYFLTLVEGAETWLDKLAVHPDPKRLEQVRRIFREAREHLHRRLHAHAITPMDPSGIDYHDYKKRYGDRLALFGNIDITWPLVEGTPADVEHGVQDHMDGLKQGGRWVAGSSHSIVNYIPHDNFLAMINAFHKYGSYDS